MILEFQHIDILSPQRRMEPTAENTLMGAGKRENQEAKEPAGKVGPGQYFDVHVSRNKWTS